MKRMLLCVLAVALFVSAACDGPRSSEQEVFAQDAVLSAKSDTAATPTDSGVASPSPIATPTPRPQPDFSANDKEAATREDLRFGGLTIGSSHWDAVETLGEAPFQQTADAERPGWTHLTTTFSDGTTIEYIGDPDGYYTIIRAVICNPAVEGPRGLHVGVDMQSILSAFRIDPPQTDGSSVQRMNERFLYGTEWLTPSDPEDPTSDPVVAIGPPMGTHTVQGSADKIAYTFLLGEDDNSSEGRLVFSFEEGTLVSMTFEADST